MSEPGGASQESIDAMLAAARAAAAAQEPDETAPDDEAAPLPNMSVADRMAAMGMAAPDEPEAAEAAPSGGPLSQAAIDAMRARAAAPPDEPEEAEVAPSGGPLSQAAIDAMRARAAAPPVDEADAAPSGGPLSQAAIDAMRARAAAPDEPEAADAAPSGGPLSQASIDVMRARAAAPPDEAASDAQGPTAFAEADAGDSMEISLEELMSTGLTPGRPLPGSEVFQNQSVTDLLDLEPALGEAAEPVTAEDLHPVEISLAELITAGLTPVARGPRKPREAAPAPAPAAQAPPPPAPEPVYDDESAPNLRLMMDVSLEITAEIGSINMAMDELLALQIGTILSLNTHAEEPVKLLANGLELALGEVVVVDEKFGVRVTELAWGRAVPA